VNKSTTNIALLYLSASELTLESAETRVIQLFHGALKLNLHHHQNPQPSPRPPVGAQITDFPRRLFSPDSALFFLTNRASLTVYSTLLEVANYFFQRRSLDKHSCRLSAEAKLQDT